MGSYSSDGPGFGWRLPIGASLAGFMALASAAWYTSQAVVTESDLAESQKHNAEERAHLERSVAQRFDSMRDRIADVRGKVGALSANSVTREEWTQTRQLRDEARAIRFKAIEDRIDKLENRRR